MVIEYHRPWTEKKFDEFLKKWYNPRVHVDPACLELGLRNIGWKPIGKNIVRIVCNRLSELGLRKRNKHEE
jgi:hypothetical protein